MHRVDLSAKGFYLVAEDRCGYNFDTKEGRPYNYFTQGVAVAEVCVDVLTGDSETLRVDIMMDIGVSINPAIDIGQIEGTISLALSVSPLP